MRSRRKPSRPALPRLTRPSKCPAPWTAGSDAERPVLADRVCHLRWKLHTVKGCNEEKKNLPVSLCCSTRVFSSWMPVKDVMYAWACVPFTGMLKSLPANTLDVPSKPPGREKVDGKELVNGKLSKCRKIIEQTCSFNLNCSREILSINTQS